MYSSIVYSHHKFNKYPIRALVEVAFIIQSRMPNLWPLYHILNFFRWSGVTRQFLPWNWGHKGERSHREPSKDRSSAPRVKPPPLIAVPIPRHGSGVQALTARVWLPVRITPTFCCKYRDGLSRNRKSTRDKTSCYLLSSTLTTQGFIRTMGALGFPSPLYLVSPTKFSLSDRNSFMMISKLN